jgi:hypothetical protein
MNGDTNNPLLPTLTADLLTRSGMHTDNLFSTMWGKCYFIETSLNDGVGFRLFRSFGAIKGLYNFETHYELIGNRRKAFYKSKLPKR